MACIAKVAQRLQYRGLAVDLTDLAIKRGFTVIRLQIDKLIDQQGGNKGAGDTVKGLTDPVAVFLPRLHALAMLVPEIQRQLHQAGVEQI